MTRVARWWALLLLVGGLVSGVRADAVKPYLVRLHLAGFRVGDTVDQYDEKQGYYLFSTGDCDGASLDLVLTPDGSDYGHDGKGKAAELPRLRSGKGINIGDTPAQVRSKLGAKPREATYDRKTGIRSHHFEAEVEIKVEKRTYTHYHADYTFHDEKLWAIHYNLQTADECGE